MSLLCKETNEWVGGVLSHKPLAHKMQRTSEGSKLVMLEALECWMHGAALPAEPGTTKTSQKQLWP